MINVKKLSNKSLNKISGGAVWTAKCHKCNKDLTNDKDSILAITEKQGTASFYVISCPDCVEEGKGFKHLFEKYERPDPITGEIKYDWKRKF